MGQAGDLVRAQRAAAAGVLGPAEHPCLEQGEQAYLPVRPVELVVLLHRHPRHPSAFGGQRITRTGQGLLFHEELLPRSLPLLLRHDRWFVHREMLFGLLLVRRHFHFSSLFRFGPISSDPFFLRETFIANAARPPVETAPATTNPMVAKQNGHIVYLLGGQLTVKLPPLR